MQTEKIYAMWMIENSLYNPIKIQIFERRNSIRIQIENMEKSEKARKAWEKTQKIIYI